MVTTGSKLRRMNLLATLIRSSGIIWKTKPISMNGRTALLKRKKIFGISLFQTSISDVRQMTAVSPGHLMIASIR